MLKSSLTRRKGAEITIIKLCKQGILGGMAIGFVMMSVGCGSVAPTGNQNQAPDVVITSEGIKPADTPVDTAQATATSVVEQSAAAQAKAPKSG